MMFNQFLRRSSSKTIVNYEVWKLVSENVTVSNMFKTA